MGGSGAQFTFSICSTMGWGWITNQSLSKDQSEHKD